MSPGEAARIRAITFDAAGTLLHPSPSVGAIYREVALAHGCERDAAALEAAFRAAFSAVSRDATVPDPEDRERDFWRRVVRDAFAMVGGGPAAFGAFFEDLWETFAQGSRWIVHSGAVDTLVALRERGYRLGVLSNWDARLHRVLADTGLRRHFDHVAISSESGSEKPDTGMFRLAERAHDATAAQMLHVGDSLKHDVAGARAAGWAVLRVRHDNGPAAPGEIGHFAQLLDLLPGI